MTRPATEPAPDPLLTCVLGLITPLLATAGIADPAIAARQAIAAYRAAGEEQLISIAQIVAFAMASLDNLRLSMPADLSMSMKLKLRGNANALNRVAQQVTATLDGQRHGSAARENRDIPARGHHDAAAPGPNRSQPPRQAPPTCPPPDDAPQQTQVLESLDAARASVEQARTTARVEPSAEQRRNLAWASAMTNVAAEYSADLPLLAPEQRRLHLMRIGALSETAGVLSRGDVSLRSRLLASTALPNRSLPSMSLPSTSRHD